MPLLDPSVYLPLHRIVLIDAAAGVVRAEITDTVHQFGVTIDHDGHQILCVHATATRVPWASCPEALPRLQALVGTPLSGSLDGAIDKTEQCTHLFDLARLAAAHGHRPGRHRYDVVVSTATSPEDHEADAVVSRNGIPQLRWQVADSQVVSDGPFKGHVTIGAAAWPAGTDDPDVRQAALMLRRALLVFYGSARSATITQASNMPWMRGACYTYRADRMAVTRRPSGFRHLAANEVEATLD